ncbi:MAG: GMC oxidoreductase [Chthoniobacterales bacterium]
MRLHFHEAAEREFDLCVAGSGPAGIILALEYAQLNPGKTVLLLEFGGMAPAARNHLDDTIRVTNPINHHAPYECTNKALGGTSATWGGRCVMYDEIDFLERPVLGGECTWDVNLLRDVEQFVPRAEEYFECGTGPFRLRDAGPIAERFEAGEVTDDVVEKWSMPTRFGRRYAASLESSAVIFLLLDCEAKVLAAPDADGRVLWLEVEETATGKRTRIRARQIVLAAGAQESTRLLLKNTAVFDRLGAVPPTLGKYYQGHVSGKIASVRFYGDPRKTEYGFRREPGGAYARRRFQFATETLRERDLLNTAIWLDNPAYYDPSHGSGPMSFMYLAMLVPVLGRKLAPPAIRHSVTKGKTSGIGRHVFNILRGLPGSLVTSASIFFRRYCLGRKLPGVFLYNPENRYALHFHAEQVPDARNRMSLAPDGATLVIDYQLTDADVESVIGTHRLLDEWLRKCGCGELEYHFPAEDLPAAIREMSRDGIHQVGTTRIAATPERGVVDDHLKVWGSANLYVCSSSAFPTSGQANPTFLLGAFAARLARHLN